MMLSACNVSNTSLPAQAPAMTPTADVPSQILSLVDNYQSCINTNTGDALQSCVDLLSSHPGEIRDTVTANPGMFLDLWKQYAFGYQLYYCTDNTVLEGYIEYNRGDLSKPLSPTPDYLRYTFANDTTASGWRITQVFDTLSGFNAWRTQNGLNAAANITSDCEFMPRINHTPLIPSA